MEKSLLALREQGVPVFSLTGIFSGYEDTLYIDPVHQRVESGGYRLLVESMADVLAAEWELTARPGHSAATGN